MQNDSTLLDFIKKLKVDYESHLSAVSSAPLGGRKVIGTLCLSSPREIVEALGAVPHRLLLTTPEAELRGGRFLRSDSCPFCRAVLGGLDRGDVRVSAVLGATTCDQMRRNLEIIARDLELQVFIFNSPRSTENPLSRAFAKQELRRIIGEMSTWLGVELNFSLLQEVTQKRRLLRDKLGRLHDDAFGPGNNTAQGLLRRFDCALPKLYGGEFLALMRLFEIVSTDYFSTKLPQIVRLAEERGSPYEKNPIRIALLGSCVGEGDDLITGLIEEEGKAAIVCDSICSGSRILKDVELGEENPLDILLKLYHDNVLCPFRRPNDRLITEVSGAVKKFKVEGVIFKTLKFCHPWSFEARRFRDTLQLPFLHLDHDFSPSAIGQMRTRIHAFIEQLSRMRKARTGVF